MQNDKLFDADLVDAGVDSGFIFRPPSLLLFLNLAALAGLLLITFSSYHAKFEAADAAHNCCDPINENRDAFLDAAEAIYRKLIAMPSHAGPLCLELLSGDRPIELPDEFFGRFNDIGVSLHRGSDCLTRNSGPIVLRANGDAATLLTVTRLRVDDPELGFAEGEGAQISSPRGGEGWVFYLRRNGFGWGVLKLVHKWIS